MNQPAWSLRTPREWQANTDLKANSTGRILNTDLTSRILHAKAHQKSGLRAHRSKALSRERAFQFQRQGDRRSVWNPGGTAVQDLAEAGEKRVPEIRARDQRRL